jgi:4-amino-4-deoxy-L-arabinose transferase-like glycosyltransferase
MIERRGVKMTGFLRHMSLIILVGICVLFSNLGGPRLWDRDEPRNAGCAAEMSARGDWITPVFNAELRTHKPILLYWLMLSAYAVFGISEFAARFWSAALAIGTSLLTYGIGRRLFSPAVGLWASVILTTTLMFDVAARAATPDSALIFWTTAALWVYVRGTFAPSGRAELAEPIRWFPEWPWAVGMYACMGMAVLAKGPVGLVLPTAVVGMYLLVVGLPSREVDSDASWLGRLRESVLACLRPFAPGHFIRTCWIMRPITAVVVAMAVAMPWYVAVDLRTDGQWVRGFLLDHNLGRAAQAMEGHRGAIVFYPLALLVGFFPWSVFAVPTILEVVRRIRQREARYHGLVLAVCWVGVFIGLFSMAQTKLPSYITPCYPAVAVLVAYFVCAWTRGASRSSPLWPHISLACLAAVGVAVMVAVPLAAARLLPGDEWLACIGLVPLLTAGIGWMVLRHYGPKPAARCFAVGAVLFTAALFALGAARVGRHQKFETIVAAIHLRSNHPEIGGLGPIEPSWVFYAGRQIDPVFAPQLDPNVSEDLVTTGVARTKIWQPKPLINIWHFLGESPDRFVITTGQILDRLGPLPENVEVLAETPYFLKRERLVLLSTNDGRHKLAERRRDSAR